jgi:hypothetical protein
MDLNSLGSLVITFLASGAATWVVVAWLLKHYVPAYLKEKGKNLATKEDIGAITNEVKQVEHQYNTLIEELKSRQQLRMAAVERRLQTHQDAFTMWRKLIAEPDESDKAVVECQDWWEKNCLYLEEPVRKAFVVAFKNAFLRNEFARIHADPKPIGEAWDKVETLSDVLFTAIQLPLLTETEKKPIESETKPAQQQQ